MQTYVGGGRGAGKFQYCGGCSVQWEIQSGHVGDNISTVGDNISTVENNISTVEDNISTVEGIQYCGGIGSLLLEITAVHEGDSISTVGDTFSTMKVVQYSGG